MIQIRALPQEEGADIQGAMTKLCLDVAKTVGCEPSHVWATWDEITPGNYVEGNIPAETQPIGTHPPIVNVIIFEGRPPELIERVLETIAGSLSESLSLDSNVFIKHTEARSGGVFTGGAVKRN